MHPISQSPPSRKPKPKPKMSQVSRAKSLPSQQSRWRERSEGSFDIHRGFDQGGKKQKNKKCDQFANLAALARLLAHGHAGPRDCKKRFLGGAACRALRLRLFARQRDKEKQKPPFVRRRSLKAEKITKSTSQSMLCSRIQIKTPSQ